MFFYSGYILNHDVVGGNIKTSLCNFFHNYIHTKNHLARIYSIKYSMIFIILKPTIYYTFKEKKDFFVYIKFNTLGGPVVQVFET